MIIHKRDLNAPRVRTSNNSFSILKRFKRPKYPDIPLSTFYTTLRDKYPHLNKYSDHCIEGMITRFNESIVDTFIEHRDGVLLPFKTGFMMLATFNKTKGVVDLRKSMELGRIVQYSNEHTDGFGGGIFYSAQAIKEHHVKPVPMYENCNLWNFKGNRKVNIKVGNAYGSNWKKYHRIDKRAKMKEIDKREFYTKRKHLPNDEFEF